MPIHRSWLLPLVLASMAASPAFASPVARCEPGALGVSRVIDMPTTGGARYGTFKYAALPLMPGEVVLTFDDGPSATTTPGVLAALQKECVLASFFMVGRNVDSAPDIARAVRQAGHNVGSHSWSHKDMTKLTPSEQDADYERGFASLRKAFGWGRQSVLYRFPEFKDTPELLRLSAQSGVAVIAADISPADWRGDPSEVTLTRLMHSLSVQKSGIIVLHDTQPNTVTLLPMMFAAFKAHGYRIVAIRPHR